MGEVLTQDHLLETRGASRDLGAYVIGACFTRNNQTAAFALGDGSVHLVRRDAPEEWRAVTPHEGGVLSIAPDAGPDGFITGGDDGAFLRLMEDGSSTRLADFGGKWVEQVTSFADRNGGLLACGVGKAAHLFNRSGEKLKTLQHPSTVTGLAFDAKGKRLGASHYNGASLWFVNSKSDNARVLEWKGSHTGIAIHPAGEAVVTAMQENALHGWRLADGQHMRMSGYPSKVEALSFTRTGKWLASSGAEAVVLWPFFAGGPMGKPPLEIALHTTLCTQIAAHPLQETVAAGYDDGTVLLADIQSERILPVAGAGRGRVTCLNWSPDGAHMIFGTETGFAAIVDFSKRG